MKIPHTKSQFFFWNAKKTRYAFLTIFIVAGSVWGMMEYLFTLIYKVPLGSLHVNIKYIFIGFMGYALIGFVVSFFLNQIKYAYLGSDAVTVFTGFLGFRRATFFEWSTIDSVKIEAKTQKHIHPGLYYGFMSPWEIDVDSLCFNFKKPLPDKMATKIRSLYSRFEPNFHSICINDKGTQVWLTQPPREGYEPLKKKIDDCLTTNRSLYDYA